MFCSCDCEMPSYTWESYHTAKQGHICCECGSKISPSDRYFRVAGVWDGDFLAFKQCEVCKKVWDEAQRVTSECICLGDLWEAFGSEFEYAAALTHTT